jgi:hypothetical protein
MVAIRILDELQEAGAQCGNDELNLLLCPEALNQLLHCPSPEIKTNINSTTISNKFPATDLNYKPKGVAV